MERAYGPSAKCLVYDSVRALILDETLARGSRLREAELAARYSTSRTPVRRALIALAREGLIEHRAGRGWFVTALRPDDARDAIAVRAMLEAHAAALAAAELSDSDHQRLERLLADMDEALAGHDIARFSSLNRQFHTSVYRACPNQRLVSMLEDFFRDFPNLGYRMITAAAEKRHREHYRILEALIARQGERVSKLVYSHFVDHFAYLVADRRCEVSKVEAAGTEP